MGFKTVTPKKRLWFVIDQSHCTTAVRKDPCRCVIAQAFYAKFGDNLGAIQVLATKTYLTFQKGVIKEYRTPPELREALKTFDETGSWNLLPGEYCLLPVAPHASAEAIRLRARQRRADGDPNVVGRKDVPYNGTKKKRSLNPRLISLRSMGTGAKT